jgi:hypothetical protein
MIRSARASMSRFPKHGAVLPEIHMDNGGIAIVCGSYVMSFMRVNEPERFFYWDNGPLLRPRESGQACRFVISQSSSLLGLWLFSIYASRN